MKINKDSLLDVAKYLPSAHFNSRPANTAIDMVVIHGITLPPNEFSAKYIEDFFCGKLDFAAHPYFETIKHLQVTSHLLIDRAGNITQFVPFKERAWHAGVSHFQGKSNCNDFSIGIELIGNDVTDYESAQYETLAQVVSSLMLHYPTITRERIVGHSEIAPGRKTDPGPVFDWNYFDCLLAKCSA